MAKSSYTRRLSTRITDTVNQYGELVDREEAGIDILVKGDEEFFFVYANHLDKLLQLKGNEMKVLLWCSMHTALNTNEIVLNKVIKGRLATAAGINLRSIDNSLNKLLKENMLRRTGTGVYLVNPAVTWKGKVSGKTNVVKRFVSHAIK